MMSIICDYRMPEQMKSKLSQFYNVVLFSAKGMVEKELDGHPDIFIAKLPEYYIIAPNTPKEILDCFISNAKKCILGDHSVGFSYPEIAAYNISVSKSYTLCNSKITDRSIFKHLPHHKIINAKQGFCRCSTFALKNDVFITSDLGIYKTLQKIGISVFFYSPKTIHLEGYANGLLGGCFGIDEEKNRIIIAGQLNYLENGDHLKTILLDLGYEMLELDDCPLEDVGGMFVIS